MRIKSLITKLVPSYRAKDAIMDELGNLRRSISELSCQMKDNQRKNEYLYFCLQHIDNESELDLKKRVFLNMPKASGDLRVFQVCSNYILKRLKTICDKNEISMMLYGGNQSGIPVRT